MAADPRVDAVTGHRCWCRGPRHGLLCGACADRLARAQRVLGEVLVRYVEWPTMYVEEGEAGA